MAGRAGLVAVPAAVPATLRCPVVALEKCCPVVQRPNVPGPAGALISDGREKPGRDSLTMHSAWATSYNFCNLRTANSDAHWADFPTHTYPVVQISASCLRFARADSALCGPHARDCKRNLDQPSARRSLPILPVMPRHPEARPASEHGRLLPWVWVPASTRLLDEAARLAQSFGHTV